MEFKIKVLDKLKKFKAPESGIKKSIVNNLHLKYLTYKYSEYTLNDIKEELDNEMLKSIDYSNELEQTEQDKLEVVQKKVEAQMQLNNSDDIDQSKKEQEIDSYEFDEQDLDKQIKKYTKKMETQERKIEYLNNLMEQRYTFEQDNKNDFDDNEGGNIMEETSNQESIIDNKSSDEKSLDKTIENSQKSNDFSNKKLLDKFIENQEQQMKIVVDFMNYSRDAIKSRDFLQNEVDSLKKQIEDFENVKTENANYLKIIDEQNISLKTFSEQANAKIRKSNENLIEIKEKYKELVERNNTIYQQKCDSEKKNEELQTKNNSVVEEKDKLVIENDILKQENENLKQQLINISDSPEKSEKEEEQQKEIERLNREVAALKITLSEESEAKTKAENQFSALARNIQNNEVNLASISQGVQTQESESQQDNGFQKIKN